MTIYVVAVAGRQVENANRDDQFVFMVEQGFLSETEADAFVRSKGKSVVETIQTQYGPIEVMCQRSITPLEIPD